MLFLFILQHVAITMKDVCKMKHKSAVYLFVLTLIIGLTYQLLPYTPLNDSVLSIVGTIWNLVFAFSAVFFSYEQPFWSSSNIFVSPFYCGVSLSSFWLACSFPLFMPLFLDNQQPTRSAKPSLSKWSFCKSPLCWWEKNCLVQTSCWRCRKETFLLPGLPSFAVCYSLYGTSQRTAFIQLNYWSPWCLPDWHSTTFGKNSIASGSAGSAIFFMIPWDSFHF